MGGFAVCPDWHVPRVPFVILSSHPQLKVMKAAMEQMSGLLEKRIIDELRKQEAHRLAHSTAKSHSMTD